MQIIYRKHICRDLFCTIPIQNILAELDRVFHIVAYKMFVLVYRKIQLRIFIVYYKPNIFTTMGKCDFVWVILNYSIRHSSAVILDGWGQEDAVWG